MSANIKATRPLSSIAKSFILLIPFGIIVFFAALFTSLFITIIVSVLLALVLNPLVDVLESKGLNRTIAVLTVFIVIGLLLFIIINLFLPSISDQASHLQRSFREFRFSEKLTVVEKWLEKNLPFMNRGDIEKELENFYKGSFTKIQTILSDAVTVALMIIIIPFLTFFILRDRITIKKSMISLVPNRYFEMTINIVDKIEQQLSRYVRGWLLDALFVGSMTAIGLSALGINNAFLIGAIAGFGHLIPYAGPIIGGIPAILISIIQFGDMSMVLPLLLLFAVIYIIDNSVAQPYIFSKSIDMNPLTIIILILLGNEILGAFGALVAIPIATILKVSAVETIRGFRNYKIANY